MENNDDNQGGRLGRATKRLVRLATECVQDDEALARLYDEVIRLLENGNDSTLADALEAASEEAAMELTEVIEDVAYSPDDLLYNAESETPLSMELIGLPICFLVPEETLKVCPDLLDRIPIEECVHALRRHLPLWDDDSAFLMGRLIAPESLATVRASAIRRCMRTAAEKISGGQGEQGAIQFPLGMEPLPFENIAGLAVCSRVIVGCFIGDETEKLLGHRYILDNGPTTEEMLRDLSTDLEQQIADFLPEDAGVAVSVMPTVLPLPSAPTEASAGRAALALACKVGNLLETLTKLQAQVRHNLCYDIALKESRIGWNVVINVLAMPSKESIFQHEAALFSFLDDPDRVLTGIAHAFENVGIPPLSSTPPGEPKDNIIPFPKNK